MHKPFCPLCNRSATKANQVNRYKYYRCAPCNLLFLFPQPSKTQIDKYYKSNFDYVAGKANEIAIRVRARNILKTLKKINPLGSNLLDIGSGYGYFAEEAHNIGIDTSAIEPSRSFHSSSMYRPACRQGRYINIALYKENFDSFLSRNKNRRYDYITIIHVIEHMNNPQNMIRSACKLLSPKGILYIETPNLDSYLYKAEQNNYTFLTPPDHLWIFSKKSIQTITPPKYQIDKVSTYSYPEHFMGILKAILTRGKNSLDRPFATGQFQPRRLELGHIDKPDEAKKGSNSSLRLLKYLLFDKCIAHLFYRLLNIDYHGSILELYIRKK